MNDLENQIAALSVASPSEPLDRRIRNTLNSYSPATPTTESREAFRGPAVATIAAACLIAGLLAGYAGAGLNGTAPPEGTRLLPNGALAIVASDQSRGDVVSTSALLTAHLQDNRFESCQRCHQSPDDAAKQLRQLRETARAKTAAWERLTGETFLLASHVVDPRFAECRQCHVVDRQVESM